VSDQELLRRLEEYNIKLALFTAATIAYGGAVTVALATVEVPPVAAAIAVGALIEFGVADYEQQKAANSLIDALERRRDAHYSGPDLIEQGWAPDFLFEEVS
jgi:hypothetical protein